MDSKNAHSTVLKGPQLMNSSFVLNSIPASGSGKTCLPWVCAATLGGGAPGRRRSKSSWFAQRAASRFWSLAKTKRKSNQSMLQDDRAKAFVCARWHDFPTVHNKQHSPLRTTCSAYSFRVQRCCPKKTRRPDGKTNPEGTRRNSIQFRNETKIAYKRKYRQNTITFR